MHQYIHPFWRQISRERSYLKVNIMEMLAPLPFLLDNSITPWVWDGTIVTVMGEDALNCLNGQVNTHPNLLMIQGSWELYHSPLNLRQGLTPSGHVCNMKSSIRYVKLQREMEKLTVTGIPKSWNLRISFLGLQSCHSAAGMHAREPWRHTCKPNNGVRWTSRG